MGATIPHCPTCPHSTQARNVWCFTSHMLKKNGQCTPLDSEFTYAHTFHAIKTKGTYMNHVNSTYTAESHSRSMTTLCFSVCLVSSSVQFCNQTSICICHSLMSHISNVMDPN